MFDGINVAIGAERGVERKKGSKLFNGTGIIVPTPFSLYFPVFLVAFPVVLARLPGFLPFGGQKGLTM